MKIDKNQSYKLVYTAEGLDYGQAPAKKEQTNFKLDLHYFPYI